MSQYLCGVWRGVLQKQQRKEQQERPVIARNVDLLRGAVGRDKPVWVDDTDAHEITPCAGAFQGEIIGRLCHIVYGRMEGFVARDLDVKLLAGQRCRPFELELAFFKRRWVKLREGFADAEARGHAEFLHIAIAVDAPTTHEKLTASGTLNFRCGGVGGGVEQRWFETRSARHLQLKCLAGRTAFPFQCDVARHELP